MKKPEAKPKGGEEETTIRIDGEVGEVG